MGPNCGAKFRERVKAVDPVIPWVHVDYGWCLTIHKSQGSEWRHVGLLLDQGFAAWCRRDRETGRRLAYTGITRARETLTAFDI
jgi:ATP-dependent exoDNAse (exonuclease V) alpha subunit